MTQHTFGSKSTKNHIEMNHEQLENENWEFLRCEFKLILYYQILWCFSDWYNCFTHNSVHICLGPDYVMVMVDDHWSTQNMKILHDVLLYVSQCRDVSIISCKYKMYVYDFCIFSWWKKSLMNVQRKRRIFYQWTICSYGSNMFYNEWNYNERKWCFQASKKTQKLDQMLMHYISGLLSCVILS